MYGILRMSFVRLQYAKVGIFLHPAKRKRKYLRIHRKIAPATNRQKKSPSTMKLSLCIYFVWCALLWFWWFINIFQYKEECSGEWYLLSLSMTDMAPNSPCGLHLLHKIIKKSNYPNNSDEMALFWTKLRICRKKLRICRKKLRICRKKLRICRKEL